MPTKEIGTFSVSYVQVLDEHGNLDGSLEPSLSEAELLRLYRSMVYAREADQRMLKMQRQGRIGTFAPCTGQEGSVCGATLAMTEKDWFVACFRELGGYLMRGMPFHRNLLFHNGFEEGNRNPEAGNTLPVDIIVGSQCLHAVGIGYALKVRNVKDAAVVCFFGDGATSQGDFHEALNYAAVWQVPVVFVCQNNQWAISLPRHKQSHSKTLAQKGIAYDVPSVQVDGNDPLAMYRVTREALDRARAGGGPTFIEAVTYRMMMHTTADDPKKYRDENDVEPWKAKDPIVRMRAYLESKGFWSADKEAALLEETRARVEAEVKTFEERTAFKPDAPFDNVYADRYDVIEEQRAEFLENLRREEADNA